MKVTGASVTTGSGVGTAHPIMMPRPAATCA